jgi:hypothetical protein
VPTSLLIAPGLRTIQFLLSSFFLFESLYFFFLSYSPHPPWHIWVWRHLSELSTLLYQLKMQQNLFLLHLFLEKWFLLKRPCNYPSLLCWKWLSWISILISFSQRVFTEGHLKHSSIHAVLHQKFEVSPIINPLSEANQNWYSAELCQCYQFEYGYMTAKGTKESFLEKNEKVNKAEKNRNFFQSWNRNWSRPKTDICEKNCQKSIPQGSNTEPWNLNAQHWRLALTCYSCVGATLVKLYQAT